MGGLLEYSGLATKIKAMDAKLLTYEDYLELAEQETIGNVVAYLKKFDAYQTVFGDRSEELLRRNQVEQLLRSTIYIDYKKIYHFSKMNQKLFLKAYFKRYEIAIIKMCLRLQFGHGELEEKPTSFMGEFEKTMSIKIDTLIGAASTDDLVNNLIGTDYYSVLKILQGNHDVKLYDYEILLDIYYFKWMWKISHKVLKRNDLKIIKKSYGSEIDMLNLQWIYRAKKFYRLEDAQLYALVIPVFFRLTKQNIRDLVKANSNDEFRHVLDHISYTRKLDDNKIADLERVYENFMKRLYRDSMKKYPYSIACIDSYLYHKDQEVENLIRLTECIRYRKSKEEIMEYLFGE